MQMQDSVYQTAIHDVDELKQRLIAVIGRHEAQRDQQKIDEWRSKLGACVRAKGHFEHLLC